MFWTSLKKSDTTMIQGVVKVGVNQLNLPRTLSTGQNFRWRKKAETDQWIGVLDNNYVLALQQFTNRIEYKVLNSAHVLGVDGDHSCLADAQEAVEKCLHHYFRLDEDIDKLYTKWSDYDPNFARVSCEFKGIRLLRQDVIENVFSFICSSNNNISRISKMIETLCTKYGTKLHSFNDLSDINSFSSIEMLAGDNIEKELRNLSFGYRAKFISESAKRMVNLGNGNPSQWIDQLTKLTYEDAKRELMSLPGIGAKVADCICLMSLGHTEAIPVDTHVYQITAKHYLPDLQKIKSLTPQRYNEIGNFYREKFQVHAGWAQTVLFCSDLKQQK